MQVIYHVILIDYTPLVLYLILLIQGITEALPVSSSMQVMMMCKMIGIAMPSKSFLALLHGASLLGILVFFYRDIVRNSRYIAILLVANIPTLILAYFVKDMEAQSVYFTAINSILFGALLVRSDCIPAKRRIKDITAKDIVILALSQPLSIFCGVSRLGICITVMRMLSFNRVSSLLLGFMMGIPTMVVASGFGFLKNIDLIRDIPGDFLIGSVITFCATYLSLLLITKEIYKGSSAFLWFGIYRIATGILVLML